MTKKMIDPHSLRTELVEVLRPDGEVAHSYLVRRDQVDVYVAIAGATNPHAPIRFPSPAGDRTLTIMGHEVPELLGSFEHAPSIVPQAVTATWADPAGWGDDVGGLAVELDPDHPDFQVFPSEAAAVEVAEHELEPETTEKKKH